MSTHTAKANTLFIVPQVKALLIAERTEVYSSTDDLQARLIDQMNEVHGVESYYYYEIPDKLAVGCVISGCHFALYFRCIGKNKYKYCKGYTSHSISKHNDNREKESLSIRKSFKEETVVDRP